LLGSLEKFKPQSDFEVVLVGDSCEESQIKNVTSRFDFCYVHQHIVDAVPVSMKINLGIMLSCGHYIIRVDDDVEFLHEGWAENMSRVISEHKVDAVSAVTPGVASGIQRVPITHDWKSDTEPIPVVKDWWGGWCFMARRELFDWTHPDYVGFYDTFAMAQGDDKDWLRRLRLYGKNAMVCPNAMVMHHGCASEMKDGHIPAATHYRWSQPNYEKKWNLLRG